MPGILSVAGYLASDAGKVALQRSVMTVTKDQVDAAYAAWQDVAHHGLNHHLAREKRECYFELRNRYGYELSLCDLVESGGIANAPYTPGDAGTRLQAG